MLGFVERRESLVRRGRDEIAHELEPVGSGMTLEYPNAD
jgi:hypothetical protein